MKMKTVVVLAFAVACGLIAMMGVQQMIAQKSNENADVPVKVLVASMDISPGVLLSEHNCEFKEYPTNVVPADAILTKEDYHDRGLLVPVTAGDIIRGSKLGGRGEIAASASIPMGMRTISIQVNDTKTHSGLIQPGDRVDLQISYSVRNASGLLITKTATLLEYIEVFASDSIRNLEAGESKEIKAKNISFLVTPEQSKLVQLANTRGELIPIMRSKEDSEITQSPEEIQTLITELKSGMMQEQDLVVEKKEDKEKQEPQSAAQAFKNFLSGQMAEAKPKPAPKPVDKPVEEPKPSNMWKIQIYAGEELIEQEVALPVSMTSGPNFGGQIDQTFEQEPAPVSQKIIEKPIQKEMSVEEPDLTTEQPSVRHQEPKQAGVLPNGLQNLLNSFMGSSSETKDQDHQEALEFHDQFEPAETEAEEFRFPTEF
ncbi:MAG TPA: Flp pilus assembly protein CpaB [Planctomycetaceae bacterium]|nr:Flp pilus assembly protein CpaB [Planctomycetaceae bacterium]